MGDHDRRENALSRRILRGFDRAAFARLREAAKLDIGDLARLGAVGETTLYGWESGRRTPQVDTLARVVAAIAEATGRPLAMDDVIRVKPGDRTLVDLRNLSGLTQPQLAAAARIRTTALSKIERGQMPLSDARADAIASVLRVDRATLLAAYARAKARPAGAPA